MVNQSIYDGFSRMWYHIVNALGVKADKEHIHNAKDIVSGILEIEQGGTGANTKESALSNLGVNAKAAELNHMSGVTQNVQDQLDSKTAVSIVRW